MQEDWFIRNNLKLILMLFILMFTVSSFSSAASWQMNWDILSPFFKYPEKIRTVMYTTNIIKEFHRQLRKITKTKSMFPSDQALFLLYSVNRDFFDDATKFTLCYDLYLRSP